MGRRGTLPTVVAWGLLSTLSGVSTSAVAAAPDSRGTNASDVWTTAPAESDKRADSTGPFRETAEQVRTWKDAFGNSMEGRFLGLFGATVLLEVEGEPVACPLVGFSVDDRDYVRSVLEARGEGHIFPGASNPQDEAAQLRMPPSQWRTQLKQWSKAVGPKGPGRDAESAQAALNHIRSICDPNAIEALEYTLAREPDEAVRTACVESLARIGSSDAAPTLVRLACTDRSGLVRAAATWALAHTKDPKRALSEYAPYFRVERYRGPAILSLHAAGLLQPPSAEETPHQAITEALIGTLVVDQTAVVPVLVWWETGWHVTPHAGGRGLHAERRGHGERRWVRFKIPTPCSLALKMLVDYTGQDYGYDQRAWRQWYEQESPGQKRGK